jgi:hypothetical protein
VRMSWHGRRERHEGNNDDCDLTHPLRIGWNSCQECGAPGRCVHLVAISRDRWPDHIRLPDLEPLLVCRACVQRSADVRPGFDWDRRPRRARAAYPSPGAARRAVSRGTTRAGSDHSPLARGA